MAHFDGMSQRTVRTERGQRPTFDARIVATRQRGCGPRIARQQRKEGIDALEVAGKALGELPEEGAQLLAQRSDARGQEIAERRLDALELQEVADVARALDREDEVARRFLAPALVEFGSLQRVERAVDLERVKDGRGVRELEPLGETLRIEPAAPGRVPPAGEADPNSSRSRGRVAPRRWGA
jgi:hypothetical protein